MSFGVVAAGLGAAGAAKSLFGGGDSQSASREPWGPAQDALKQFIKDGQNQYQYYQQQPFNSLQQTAYQNLFSDADNFRNNVVPGLLSLTNKYLTRDGGQPISLLTSGATNAGGGAPAQSFGLLDWTALNPYTNGGLNKTPAVADKTPEELLKEQEEERRRQQDIESGYRFA